MDYYKEELDHMSATLNFCTYLYNGVENRVIGLSKKFKSFFCNIALVVNESGQDLHPVGLH